MYLPDHEIDQAIMSGRMHVHPYDVQLLQPGSLDVRLSHLFRVFGSPGTRPRVDIRHIPDDLTQEVDGSNGFTLHPGDFVLGSTIETVEVPADLMVKYDGKSTLGRLGLLTHVTAGLIDPGYRGQITLELRNVGTCDLTLWPGEPIGQITLELMTSPAARPYGSPGLRSRYQGQQGPTAPRAKATQ